MERQGLTLFEGFNTCSLLLFSFSYCAINYICIYLEKIVVQKLVSVAFFFLFLLRLHFYPRLSFMLI